MTSNARLHPPLRAPVIDQVRNGIHRLEWLRLLFLLVLPVYALAQIPHTPLQWPTLLWGVWLYILTGLGITAGYHRLWSHSSYSATLPLRVFLALAATGALQGSIKWWCSRHREHHRYTDTDHDPYNVKNGFWRAHLGWMLWKVPAGSRRRVETGDLRNVSCLSSHITSRDTEGFEDPVVSWQHRHIFPLQIITGILIPVAVPGLLWGDWRGGIVYAFILRMAAVHHATFCVNSLAHLLGDAPFDDRHSPRDHFITAWFTFGEGYHNFHHTFPSDYRNAVKWYQYDPTKWAVSLWSKMGLAYNLKTFPSTHLDKTELQQTRKNLQKKQVAVDERLRQLGTGIPIESLPVMDWEIFSESNALGEALIAIAGVVYDISTFAENHPGGRELLLSYAGKDATALFNGGVYLHSRSARNLLPGLQIAVLRGGGEVETWKSSDVKDLNSPLRRNPAVPAPNLIVTVT